MTGQAFTNRDLEDLAARGIRAEEAARQLALLSRPPAPVRLDRPCTVGDGILRISVAEADGLAALGEEAAAAGRLLKFVPASGAATRMFRDLLVTREAGSPILPEELAGRIRHLPFYEDLWEVLARQGRDLDAMLAEGPPDGILGAMLGPEGLALADLPKGLLKFHRYEDGRRTAFEEHLAEAARTVADAWGGCRLHFTVSREHLPRFQALLARAGPGLEDRYRVRFDVAFSCQDPSTDTIAAATEGGPFRGADGRLVFRPGGHGALLRNLAGTGGDVVLVKNIDNVQPERLRGETIRWKRVLAGLLVRVQRTAFDLLDRLQVSSPSREAVEEAARFLEAAFHVTAPEGAAAERLAARLDRPLRVCGVVRNTGEPGGGPFWVRARDGSLSLQIVEGAEVDLASPEQRSILRASTHFNPVDMACALRDASGRPYRLEAFADPEAVLVTRKSLGGRDLLALEHPGLWNGGMARWNTVFVEVPPDTFTPVKTVLDLLRPEHQPA